jgi:hypothetical protein
LAEGGTVEVTDPTHPLHGRRFPIHSVSRPARGPGHVFVVYREHVHLRIPVAATDLAPCPRPAHPAKFTLESIRHFVALAQECLSPCPNDPTPSGTSCPPP